MGPASPEVSVLPGGGTGQLLTRHDCTQPRTLCLCVASVLFFSINRESDR